MNKKEIFIVDDHTLFRNGLKLLLSGFENTAVVAEASNGREFLDQYANFPSSIVLMDIDMPVMDGLEATRLAVAQWPEIKIIALSMFGDEEYYYKMIEAGVKGFLLKNSDIGEVKEAIDTVASHGNYFSKELLYNVVRNIRKITTSSSMETALSERETEILYHICKGKSNQDIANLLHISKRTVDKHRANLLDKTQAHNTASLVMFAIKNKLVEL